MALLGERGLRILLRVMGSIMLVVGTTSVLIGASSVLSAGDFTAAIDSEMRFFAVWYAVAGAMLLRASRNVRDETWTIRLIAGAFFAAGCSRIVSWIVVGRPHTSQLVLMVIELILPFVVVPWQAAAARRRPKT